MKWKGEHQIGTSSYLVIWTVCIRTHSRFWAWGGSHDQTGNQRDNPPAYSQAQQYPGVVAHDASPMEGRTIPTSRPTWAAQSNFGILPHPPKKKLTSPMQQNCASKQSGAPRFIHLTLLLKVATVVPKNLPPSPTMH